MPERRQRGPSPLQKSGKRAPNRYEPLLWVLDEDPAVAAHLLNGKYLDRSITSGIQILLCVRFWLAGIRNRKAFAYWFSKDRAEDTMRQIFGDYPFKRGEVLKFTFFTHRTTKWTRKCREHMKFVEDFVWNGVCEWMQRTERPHPSYDLAEFLCRTSPASRQMPEAHLKRIIPEWKSIPPWFRQNNVYKAFRVFYASRIGDPWAAYANDRVDIPEFLVKNDFS